MCDQCKNEISDFRSRSVASPWKLDRGLMADRLEEILANPDTIQQGALGLCGVAAFLRAWILNDHLAVARFALDLYERGKSHINAYEVNPCDDLLNCDYSAIQWLVDGKPAPPCPPAEWMIMSALQDEANIVVDFEGSPGKGGGQTYGDVAGWFEATDLYTKVDQQFPTIPVMLPYNTPGINHLLGLHPDDDTDVVLNIHSKLIANPDDSLFAFITNDIPNHFIGLCSPATKIVDSSGVEKVMFTYFSWGQIFPDRIFTKEEFEDSYYGALVADARTFKKPLAPLPTAVPLRPHHLTASLSGSTVKLTWQCSSLHVIKYVVERSSLRETIGTPSCLAPTTSADVRASRPSTLGGTFEDVLPAPAASEYRSPEYWYRVKAVNWIGESEFSYDVMVSVPSGTVREIHPWDADVSLPPMHARRLTVVRAPAGLVPIGYANFATPTCECRAPQVVYDAIWEYAGGHVRRLNKTSDLAFKPDRAAYIFIHFGTGDWGDWGDGVLMDGGPVSVKLTASPAGSPAINIPLTLQPGTGGYYWGVFTPDNVTQTSYTFSVEVSAQDSFARYAPRFPSGDMLDGDPRTEAYADTTAPLYRFMNYEPGSDTNHAFHVGFVRSQLDPDRLETNNDFGHATVVQLSAPDEIQTQRKAFDQLTLGNASDVDYFALQFSPSQKDKDCQLLQPGTVVLSTLLGLSKTFYPPRLIVSLKNDDLDCMDIMLFTSDVQGRAQKHIAQGMYSLSVWNPLRVGYPDAKLYAMVKNGDYASQGAIGYGVAFYYGHAVEKFGVDPNAPGYGPRTTEARKFLRELYEKLDLPRPGDDIRQQFSHDSRATIVALTKVLVDPATTSTLQGILGRDVRRDVAADCASVAKVADTLSIPDAAERLYIAASTGFETIGDRTKQLDALRALAVFYDHANLSSKAAAIRKRIRLIAG